MHIQNTTYPKAQIWTIYFIFGKVLNKVGLNDTEYLTLKCVFLGMWFDNYLIKLKDNRPKYYTIILFIS